MRPNTDDPPFPVPNHYSAREFPACGVSCLRDEVLLDVEKQAVVVVLYLAQLEEVQTSRRTGVCQQINGDRALRRLDNHAHSNGSPCFALFSRTVQWSVNPDHIIS